MKKTALLIIGLTLLCSGPADALVVKKARIRNGALEVRGKEAVPNAVITLDGVAGSEPVKASGAFKTSAVLLPADCIVTVSDGAASVDAVVSNCAPAGPQGAQGQAGPPGFFHVIDSGGTDLGALVSVEVVGGNTVYSVRPEPLGLIVSLSTDNDGGVGNPGSVAFFPAFRAIQFIGLDCTGQAYIELVGTQDENFVQSVAQSGDLTQGRFFKVGNVVTSAMLSESLLSPAGTCINTPTQVDG